MRAFHFVLLFLSTLGGFKSLCMPLNCDRENPLMDSCSIDLDRDLVAHFPFDGNAEDVSSNMVNATCFDVTPTTNRDGVMNAALHFSEVSSLCNLTDSEFDIDSFKTFTLWMKTESTGLFRFLHKNNAPPDRSYWWELNFFNPGKVVFRYSTTGSNLFNIESNQVYNEGEWVFLVLQVDLVNLEYKIYKNGLLDLQTSLSGIISNSSNALSIRNNNGSSVHFEGDFDDFRVYDRMLNDCEIEALYALNECPIDLTSDLVAHYPFDGNAKDISGNMLDGNLVDVIPGQDRFMIDSAANEFQLTSSLCEFSDTEFDIDSFKTYTLWISTTSTGLFRFLHKNNPPPDRSYWWELNFLNPGRIVFRYSTTGSNLFNIESNQVYNEGEWVFLTLQVDHINDTYKIYKNGVLDLEAAIIGDVSNSSNVLSIRNNNGSSVQFVGGLDDIRVYNRILNVCEINELYLTEGCFLEERVSAGTFDNNNRIFAEECISADSIDVNSPFQLHLKAPEVKLLSNIQIDDGARLRIVNETGCVRN